MNPNNQATLAGMGAGAALIATAVGIISTNLWAGVALLVGGILLSVLGWVTNRPSPPSPPGPPTGPTPA